MNDDFLGELSNFVVFVNDSTIHFATGKWGWVAVLVCCDVPGFFQSPGWISET